MMKLTELQQDLIRPEIQALSAYHVPDATGLIKLDAMENPYTWPETLRAFWVDQLHQIDVNRYPDPEAQQLKQRLRQAFYIPEEMGLLLGNGSDELIQMLAMTLARPGRLLLTVEPGFVMYRMIATFCGLDYCGIQLNPQDFSLNAERMLQTIKERRPALIFLAYPNNPTGNLFDDRLIGQIIEAAPGLVVIDEAYSPFTNASFLPRLSAYPNLLVMRTLSKMGFAGLRLGFLVGLPNWIDEINKIRLPYNINVLTQMTAAFALKHQAVFTQQSHYIRSERDRMYYALHEVPGVTPYPSDANFILLRLPAGQADRVYTQLRDQAKILVKNLHQADPLLTDCLRVTVGLQEENQRFLNALRQILNQ